MKSFGEVQTSLHVAKEVFLPWYRSFANSPQLCGERQRPAPLDRAQTGYSIDQCC